MVDQICAGNETSSDTTVSLNLSGATVSFNDDDNEYDNHSELSEDDGDKDCHSLQLSNNVLPPNTSLNVENSSDVIVGPVTQFHGPVTIYQNTHNNTPAISDTPSYLSNGSLTENSISSTATTFSSAKLVTSESLPGKPLGNVPFSRKKITIISILVFVIIVLLTVIVSYAVGVYINTENNRDVPPYDDINDIKSTPGGNQIIPGSSHKTIYRDRWGGRKPLYERPQKTPVKYVIISHTAGSFCNSITTCSKQMTQIQSKHVTEGSPDIGYNFLIGGDANIYVARGWDNHNFHMNLDTIGISYIGNYIFDQLTPGMIEATHELLKDGVEKKKLDKDFILVGHNQTYNTQSPGDNVYKQIKFWPHFSAEYVEDIADQT